MEDILPIHILSDSDAHQFMRNVTRKRQLQGRTLGELRLILRAAHFQIPESVPKDQIVRILCGFLNIPSSRSSSRRSNGSVDSLSSELAALAGGTTAVSQHQTEHSQSHPMLFTPINGVPDSGVIHQVWPPRTHSSPIMMTNTICTTSITRPTPTYTLNSQQSSPIAELQNVSYNPSAPDRRSIEHQSQFTVPPPRTTPVPFQPNYRSSPFTHGGEALEIKKLELRQREIEFAREEALRESDRTERELQREHEKQRLRAEFEEKERQRRHELEMRRLPGMGRGDGHRNRNNTDDLESKLTKRVKLVPVFDETKVPEWFDRFERKCVEFDWQEQCRVGLVSLVLRGRALEAYDRLPANTDYDTLKEAVLRAYELRPEAYRLSFRGIKKRPNDSHLDTAKYMRDCLKKWTHAEGVNTYENIVELILLEQFMNIVEEPIKLEIKKRGAKNLTEAATIADDYSLSTKGTTRTFDKTRLGNKGNYSNNNSLTTYTNDAKYGSRGYGSGYGNYNKPFHGQSKPPYSKGASGYTPNPNGNSQQRQQNNNQHKGDTKKAHNKPEECTYCHRKGHNRSTCYKLNPKNVNVISSTPSDNDGPKPIALVGILGDTKTREWCQPFIHKGVVTVNGQEKEIVVLRDTGAQQTVLRSDLVPDSKSKEFVLCKGVSGSSTCPIAEVNLSCPLFKGNCNVALLHEIPIDGVDLLLGSDLVGGKVYPDVVIASGPLDDPIAGAIQDYNINNSTFTNCAVTRSMTKMANEDGQIFGPRPPSVEPVEYDSDSVAVDSDSEPPDVLDEGNTRSNHLHDLSPVDIADSIAGVHNTSTLPQTTQETLPNTQITVSDPTSNGGTEEAGVGVSAELCTSKRKIKNYKYDTSLTKLTKYSPHQIHQAQKADCSLSKYFSITKSQDTAKPGDFFIEDTLLHRQGESSQSLVVPSIFRKELVKLAHEYDLSGHLGVEKTLARLKVKFWWPKMVDTVSYILRSCHICQLVGKPNQAIPKAPLIPIPVVETPFTRVLVDIVGPLPTTSSGKSYLLTMMDSSTRYAEAIPLSSMNAKRVLDALIHFFTTFGLPREVQSDQGSNFQSKLFNQSLAELGIRHVTSSAYHPQSQGALERFHQTLKSMLRKFCHENDKEWDKSIPFVMFAARDVPNDSLGFSPNDLVFAHRVRGPVDVVFDAWSSGSEDPQPLLKYVQSTRERLLKATKMARDNLCKAQSSMKEYYDRNTRVRSFKVGDEVLALLPVLGKPLAAKYSGPYTIKEVIGDTNYKIETPDRRKDCQICHVNMLRPYFRLPINSESEMVLPLTVSNRSEIPCVSVGAVQEREDAANFMSPGCTWDSNSSGLLKEKVEHLKKNGEDIINILRKYPACFNKVPGRTTWTVHDVVVATDTPIRLQPYRVSPLKQEALRKELDYMLTNNLVVPAESSEWASPITLQPKPDGSVRFCIDYRRVNAVTKPDSYPLPRVDDSVDAIGAAKYITKVDLVKGFWQIPLSECASHICTFVVQGQVYRPLVMPYGLKNAPATFQRLMDKVVRNIDNCVVYIDDVVLYDTSYDAHLQRIDNLFARLSKAGLVINLEKSEFCRASVLYLGYTVGHGTVSPPSAKVEAINNFPPPTTKKGLQRFLGMIGYYRRFIKGLSTLLSPLTALLGKDVKYRWTDACQEAFNSVKILLSSAPILHAPDFKKPFILATDASDVGVGAVLIQLDEQGIEHPVSYFSKKLDNAQRNYSVIERELLAIVLALQHFHVYLPSYGPQVKVYSDHHPLQFLNKFKFKNQRLTRWALLLQEYDLAIYHIKGADNVLADCLSRIEE